MSQNATPSVDDTGVSLYRRSLLLGAAAVTSMAGLGLMGAAGAATEGGEHAHHHHHPATDSGRQQLVSTTSDCIVKGQACLNHCIELFKTGDTSTAGCADLVQEMLAACTALGQLAAYDSRHLKEMTQVCVGICEDGEKECRKHEAKHAECKACADACAECIRVCKAYLA